MELLPFLDLERFWQEALVVSNSSNKYQAIAHQCVGQVFVSEEIICCDISSSLEERRYQLDGCVSSKVDLPFLSKWSPQVWLGNQWEV